MTTTGSDAFANYLGDYTGYSTQPPCVQNGLQYGIIDGVALEDQLCQSMDAAAIYASCLCKEEAAAISDIMLSFLSASCNGQYSSVVFQALGQMCAQATKDAASISAFRATAPAAASATTTPLPVATQVADGNSGSSTGPALSVAIPVAFSILGFLLFLCLLYFAYKAFKRYRNSHAAKMTHPETAYLAEPYQFDPRHSRDSLPYFRSPPSAIVPHSPLQRDRPEQEPLRTSTEGFSTLYLRDD